MQPCWHVVLWRGIELPPSDAGVPSLFARGVVQCVCVTSGSSYIHRKASGSKNSSGGQSRGLHDIEYLLIVKSSVGDQVSDALRCSDWEAAALTYVARCY